MSEPAWEELTRSPLDPDPEYDSPVLDWLVPLLIAAALGLALGTFAFGGDDVAAMPTTLAPAEPSTEPPAAPDPDPILPAGYTDAGGVGLRALATYGRDGNLYVVMNQAIRSDRNPVEATAFHASDWVLAGDGVEIAATRAIESVLAPGMRTIEFPGVTALPDAEPNLVVRRSSPMVVRTGCQGCGATAVDNAAGEVTLPGIGRPYSLDEPLLISVATGLTLSVDTAEFTDEWGYIEWRVIDENDARVRVDVRIVFDGTGDPESNGENPTALLPTHLFSTSQQNPTPFNPRSFTRSGALQLERVGELINEENQPTAIRLTWVVEWQHAVGERIVLSLDGVTDLGNLD